MIDEQAHGPPELLSLPLARLLPLAQFGGMLLVALAYFSRVLLLALGQEPCMLLLRPLVLLLGKVSRRIGTPLDAVAGCEEGQHATNHGANDACKECCQGVCHAGSAPLASALCSPPPQSAAEQYRTCETAEGGHTRCAMPHQHPQVGHHTAPPRPLVDLHSAASGAALVRSSAQMTVATTHPGHRRSARSVWLVTPHKKQCDCE